MVGAWLRLVVNSAFVAAVAVAAQLGAGDVLGVIQWQGPHDDRSWTTLLTWVAFSYAVAVLAGAMVGRIAVRHPGAGLSSRLTATLIAAAGAGAAIGLAWLPTRGLVPPTNDNPGVVVTLTAGAGVVVGLLLGLVALTARPVAIALQATVAALWLIGIGAATAGLAAHQPYPAPRLAMLDAPSIVPVNDWTGPRVLVIAAVLTGVLVSAVARLRGARRPGAALAGVGGPALVAAAYLIAGPADDTVAPWALYATGAGLLASTVVALPGRRKPRPVAEPAAALRAPAATQTAIPAPAEAVGEPPRPVAPEVIEVVRGTATTTSSRPARPAWAQGSGPYASAARAAATAPTAAQPPVGQPVTAIGVASVPSPAMVQRPARPGWDGDTMVGRHAARD